MAQLGPNTTYWYGLKDASGNWLKVNGDLTLSFDSVDDSCRFSFIFSDFISPSDGPGYLIFSHTSQRFLEVRQKGGKVSATAATNSPSSTFVLYGDGSGSVSQIGGASSHGRWYNANKFVFDGTPSSQDNVVSLVLAPFTP